jgi:hypothetical protein
MANFGEALYFWGLAIATPFIPTDTAAIIFSEMPNSSMVKPDKRTLDGVWKLSDTNLKQ